MRGSFQATSSHAANGYSDQPIVVERALYADALGIHWQAGSNATATRLPATVP